MGSKVLEGATVSLNGEVLGKLEDVQIMPDPRVTEIAKGLRARRHVWSDGLLRRIDGFLFKRGPLRCKKCGIYARRRKGNGQCGMTGSLDVNLVFEGGAT